MTHHAAAERRELAETLRRTDPGAPTLCDPWTAAELAAHLVLRGRSPRYVFAQTRDEADALRRQRELVTARGYEALIEDVATIGRLSPARLGPADDAVNLIEYVVHHEDVRRTGANWAPRSLPADREAALWRHLRGATRTVFRGAIEGLSLQWIGAGPGVSSGSDADSGSKKSRVDGKDAELTVSGSPVELTLVALGRARVAKVELDGSPEAIARFRERARRKP